MHRQLGALLVDGGFVSPDVLAAALQTAQAGDETLGDILVRGGHLSIEEYRAVQRLQSIVTDMHAALSAAADDQGIDLHLLHSGQISPGEYDSLHTALRKRENRERARLAQLLLRYTHMDYDQIHACTDAPQIDHAQCRARAAIRLGDLLVASGDINRRQLQQALKLQKSDRLPLGQVLLKRGWLAPSRMRRVIRLQHKLAAAAFGAAMAFSHTAYAEEKGIEDKTGEAVLLASISESDSNDLRFASLTDLNEHITSNKERRSTIRERNRDFRLRNARARAEVEARKLKKKASEKQARIKLTPQLVRPWVQQFAKEYRLPVDLVMAVIHTESNFVSNARSRSNAIGLMQLIPKTGGRAAYTYLRGRKTTPTREELMDPRTNIELGSAYLRLLNDRYFRNIQDQELRNAVVLAAYNWGPGSMKSLIRAHGKPQSLAELRSLLKQHAPRETARYVDIVNERRKRYAAGSNGLLANR